MTTQRTARIDRFGSALFAALGLLPVTACGGSVKGDPGGSGGGGGGGDTSASSTGSPTTSSGGVNPFACVDPQPRIVDGVDTGYDACSDGTLRRPAIVACPSLLPRDGEACTDGGLGSCTTDAECPGPNGFCDQRSDFEGGCGCAVGCTADSECGEGSICVCGDPVGRCAPASCASDADCGGLECRSWDSSQGCGSVDFACQTAADTCGGDADCVSQLCQVQEGGARACGDGGCAIGRPFLVGDEERVAPVERRADWRQSYPSGAVLTPDVESVPSLLRPELAERWTRIAQMEHASIAAFARFTLQLLAVGAPPDLIERSHRAMADETAHARAAFAVASAYAHKPIGPGRLALDGAMESAVDLAAIVRLVIREGCVGETVAAIEATEAEAHCADPVVRSLLGRIADEEGQHAELAWRTVRWALASGEASVRAAVVDELDRLQAEAMVLSPPTTTAADDSRLQWGLVTDGLRAALRSSAIERVIIPGLNAALTDTGRRAA